MKTQVHSFADRASAKLKSLGYDIKRAHLYDAVAAGFSFPDTNVLFAKEKAGAIHWPLTSSDEDNENKNREDLWSALWRVDKARRVILEQDFDLHRKAASLLSILYCDPIHLLSFENPSPVRTEGRALNPDRIILDLITGTTIKQPLSDARGLLLHMMRSWRICTIDSHVLRSLLGEPQENVMGLLVTIAHHIAMRLRYEQTLNLPTVSRPFDPVAHSATMAAIQEATPDLFHPSNAESEIFSGPLATLIIEPSYLEAWSIADGKTNFAQLAWLVRTRFAIVVEAPKPAQTAIVNGLLAMMPIAYRSVVVEDTLSESTSQILDQETWPVVFISKMPSTLYSSAYWKYGKWLTDAQIMCVEPHDPSSGTKCNREELYQRLKQDNPFGVVKIKGIWNGDHPAVTSVEVQLSENQTWESFGPLVPSDRILPVDEVPDGVIALMPYTRVVETMLPLTPPTHSA